MEELRFLDAISRVQYDERVRERDELLMIRRARFSSSTSNPGLVARIKQILMIMDIKL